MAAELDFVRKGGKSYSFFAVYCNLFPFSIFLFEQNTFIFVRLNFPFVVLFIFLYFNLSIVNSRNYCKSQSFVGLKFG